MKLKNITKSKILNKEISFGVGIRQARTVDIGKIMKTCGYDWLFIDLEHNSMDIDMATQISMAAQDTGITPIVRVPDFAHHHATRVLDCGSQGIVFPHVDDKETAERLVSNCLFPPKGHRSMTGLLPQLDFKKYPVGEVSNIINNNLSFFFFTGFLGCFSTFSSFIYQLFILFHQRNFSRLFFHYCEVILISFICFNFLLIFFFRFSGSTGGSCVVVLEVTVLPWPDSPVSSFSFSCCFANFFFSRLALCFAAVEGKFVFEVVETGVTPDNLFAPFICSSFRIRSARPVDRGGR